MTASGAPLDAATVRQLFQELSDRLAAQGQRAQLFVVGGAAMALEYEPGRLTRDVDALFVPASEVRQAASAMSAAHGLEPDWLNDAAKGFLPGPDEHPRTVFESEALLVQVPSPEYLLAMKLHASRDERDLDDAASLFVRLGYGTGQQAVDLLAATYPVDQLLPRHRYIAEDIAERARKLRRELDARPVHERAPDEAGRATDPGLRRKGQGSETRPESDPWVPPDRYRPSGPTL